MALGLPYAEFWTLSLRETALVRDAVYRREARKVEQARTLNQELGVLMKYAYHDPNNMPDLVKAAAAAQARRQKAGASAPASAITEQEGAVALRAGLLSWMQQKDTGGCPQ